MFNEDFKIIRGDCLDILKDIPAGSIDMILTDPPYATTKCSWDSVIPMDDMWKELNRVTKDGASIALFGSEPFSSHLRLSNLKNYRYDWIWEKNKSTGFLNANRRPLVKHEFIHIFCDKAPPYNPQGLIKKEKPTINRGDRGRKKEGPNGEVYGKANRDSIQYYTNYPVSILKFGVEMKAEYHPTQKPVELLEYLIKTYSDEGDIILDFTMGSGSTGVACVNTNRKFIGIELDESYYNIARMRIDEALETKEWNRFF